MLTRAVSDSALCTVLKNLANFRNEWEEVPWRENFLVILRKHGIISSDIWEISPPWDFLPYNLGNLPCFGDSKVYSAELGPLFGLPCRVEILQPYL
jgi:hypothetical protein